MRISQPNHSQILIDFDDVLKANAAIFNPQNYTCNKEIKGIRIAGSFATTVNSVVISLTKPFLSGTLTLSVSGLTTEDGSSYTDSASMVASVTEAYFIDIEGITEEFIDAKYTQDIAHASDIVSGSTYQFCIDETYMRDLSSIGSKLDLSKGFVLNDNWSVELIDTDGYLNQLFAIDDQEETTMTMWQMTSGSAFTTKYFRDHTEASQEIRLVEDVAGQSFASGSFIFGNRNTLKITSKASVGTFNGYEVFDYDVEPQLVNSKRLDAIVGQQIVIDHPSHFEGRICKIIRYRNGAFEVLFAGPIESLEITGPGKWKLEVSDMTKIASQRPQLAANNLKRYFRFDQELVIQFRKVVVGEDMRWIDSERSWFFGRNAFDPDGDLFRPVPLKYLMRNYRLPWGLTNPDVAQLPTTLAHYGRLPDVVQWTIGPNLSDQEIINTFQDTFDFNGSGYWVKYISSATGEVNFETDTDAPLGQVVYIPVIYKIDEAETNVPTDPSWSLEDVAWVDSDTAIFLKMIGLGKVVDNLKNLAENNNSKWLIRSNVPRIVGAENVEPESPTYNVSTSSTEVMPRFFLERTPTRQSSSLSAGANDDIYFAVSNDRGFDCFTNNVTEGSTGYFASGTFDMPVYLSAGDWVGLARLGPIGTEELETGSGDYYDYIVASRVRSSSKEPNQSGMLEELVWVGNMFQPLNTRTDAIVQYRTNPVEWLRSFITSTGRRSNTSYDLFPKAHGLASSIDTAAFDKAINESQGCFAYGYYKQSDLNGKEALAKIAQDVCFPCGLFLGAKRSGEFTVFSIKRLMAHETPTYTLTNSNILAKQYAALRDLTSPYDRVLYEYGLYDTPENFPFKKIETKAADGRYRGESANTLSLKPKIYGEPSLLSTIASFRILPLLKRKNLMLEVTVPEVDDDGQELFNLYPGDIVQLTDVTIENQLNSRTISGEFVTTEVKYDPMQKIVELKLLYISDQNEQRGYHFSGRIINVDSSNEVVFLEQDDTWDGQTSPVGFFDTGAARVLYNASEYVAASSSYVEADEYTDVTERSTACFEYTLTTAATALFDVASSGTTTTAVIASTDARSRYWVGLNLMTNSTDQTDPNGIEITDVTYAAGDTTITFTPALAGPIVANILLWTNKTYMVAADYTSSTSQQKEMCYAAEGQWLLDLKGNWVRQPLKPYLVSGASTDVTIIS